MHKQIANNNKNILVEDTHLENDITLQTISYRSLSKRCFYYTSYSDIFNQCDIDNKI